MASIAKQKEREFIIECIRLYQSLPALWKVKSQDYNNRSKKKMAYEVLLQKYREMFPEATRDDLKRKFNALRTNYRKDVKRHNELLKSGDSSDSLSERKLWYFNEMSFLQENETEPGSTKYKHELDNSFDNSQKYTTEFKTVVCKDEYDEEEEDDEKYLDINSSSDDIDDNGPENERTSKKKLKRPAIKRSKTEEKTNSDDIKDIKDECFYWAMSFAEDLRNMDINQRIYAKKAIAEIVMEGRLGRLQRNSVKILNE